MSKYAVINLKTDPKLKALAAETADKLGISLSAVLNNELRRFTSQQSVIFEAPEIPNNDTKKQLNKSKEDINAGDYHKFTNNKKALDFLNKQLS